MLNLQPFDQQPLTDEHDAQYELVSRSVQELFERSFVGASVCETRDIRELFALSGYFWNGEVQSQMMVGELISNFGDDEKVLVQAFVN